MNQEVSFGLCCSECISKPGKLGNRQKNGLCQPHSSVMETTQLQGNSSPSELCMGGSIEHGTHRFLDIRSNINTWLISNHFSDQKVSARGLSVHMERWLLQGERFWDMPLHLAGSDCPGIEAFRILQWRAAGSNFPASFDLFLSLSAKYFWLVAED